MELNRKLAELIGWTEIIDVGGALLGQPPAGQHECRGQAQVPDWTGDWRACGPLLAAQLKVDDDFFRAEVVKATIREFKK